MDPKKGICFFLISFFIVISISSLVFIVTYTVSCWISPPYVMEATGEKHPTMPIGQTILAGILSVVTGLILVFLSFKRFIKEKNR